MMSDFVCPNCGLVHGYKACKAMREGQWSGALVARGAPDVSLAATPAREDIQNALQILHTAQTSAALMFPDESEPAKDLGAVARLLRQALQKLEAK